MFCIVDLARARVSNVFFKIPNLPLKCLCGLFLSRQNWIEWLWTVHIHTFPFHENHSHLYLAVKLRPIFWHQTEILQAKWYHRGCYRDAISVYDNLCFGRVSWYPATAPKITILTIFGRNCIFSLIRCLTCCRGYFRQQREIILLPAVFWAFVFRSLLSSHDILVLFAGATSAKCCHRRDNNKREMAHSI